MEWCEDSDGKSVSDSKRKHHIHAHLYGKRWHGDTVSYCHGDTGANSHHECVTVEYHDRSIVDPLVEHDKQHKLYRKWWMDRYQGNLRYTVCHAKQQHHIHTHVYWRWW